VIVPHDSGRVPAAPRGRRTEVRVPRVVVPEIHVPEIHVPELVVPRVDSGWRAEEWERWRRDLEREVERWERHLGDQHVEGLREEALRRHRERRIEHEEAVEQRLLEEARRAAEVARRAQEREQQLRRKVEELRRRRDSASRVERL
jgi:hypothetical protein